MRSKLPRRQIFGSLVFPIMVIVWALFNYIWSTVVVIGGFFISVPYLVAIVFGGILPIILTLALGIDTAQYFLPRFLIFIFTFAVIAMAQEFIGEAVYGGGEILIYIVSLAFSAVYFYKVQPTKFSEWMMIFFTNPYLYYLIYYFLLMREFIAMQAQGIIFA